MDLRCDAEPTQGFIDDRERDEGLAVFQTLRVP
jgi:hypothetical protein